MNIMLFNIKVKDVFNGFEDKGEDGIFAYGGKLTIRPAYQREFVYDLKQQEAVLHTVLKKFPLNTMYWVKTNDDHPIVEGWTPAPSDEFEVLDGQQRTLSVMQFLRHKLQINVDGKAYYEDSLPDDLYNSLLNYNFMVYICEGTESEKLDWFKVVNVAGEELTPQELRNSVYTGKWLSDAKRYFSKSNCAAKGLSERYIIGAPIRQELLEKALKGIVEYKKMERIEEYMAAHKSDSDADELWQYFQDVIRWVEKIFPKYDSGMKGIDWCHLYNKYHEKNYNSSVMKKEVERLLADEEVTKGGKKGIYEYLLCRDEDPFAARLLQLRTFDERDKRAAYAEQKGICAICHKHFEYDQMEGDHIKPWSKGGQTVYENLQMLCKDCNGKKSNRY